MQVPATLGVFASFWLQTKERTPASPTQHSGPMASPSALTPPQTAPAPPQQWVSELLALCGTSQI